MWELDCEESWALKNWCFWTVVLEKTLESPLGSKEIQPVHLQGNQSWLFRRTDAEAEAPILWPPDEKNWLRGWDGWMVSPTQWTWVWASSWSWWWTGRPGMLQSMGSQRVRHDWVTEPNWAPSPRCWQGPGYQQVKVSWEAMRWPPCSHHSSEIWHFCLIKTLCAPQDCGLGKSLSMSLY